MVPAPGGGSAAQPWPASTPASVTSARRARWRKVGGWLLPDRTRGESAAFMRADAGLIGRGRPSGSFCRSEGRGCGQPEAAGPEPARQELAGLPVGGWPAIRASPVAHPIRSPTGGAASPRRAASVPGTIPPAPAGPTDQGFADQASSFAPARCSAKKVWDQRGAERGGGAETQRKSAKLKGRSQGPGGVRQRGSLGGLRHVEGSSGRPANAWYLGLAAWSLPWSFEL